MFKALSVEFQSIKIWFLYPGLDLGAFLCAELAGLQKLCITDCFEVWKSFMVMLTRKFSDDRGSGVVLEWVAFENCCSLFNAVDA
ncbi:hypothetical protein TNCV_4686241 [Trichonephila clavipes]|nr:hypothetical protein TNCV_4686241 [Trichonephila clavipes]